jgi:hypothetical protein
MKRLAPDLIDVGKAAAQLHPARCGPFRVGFRVSMMAIPRLRSEPCISVRAGAVRGARARRTRSPVGVAVGALIF